MSDGATPRPETAPPTAPESTALAPTTTVVGGYPGGGETRHEILHGVDGVAWSRESIAELLGVSDSDISLVTRVQTMGNTVVVAVNLVPASQDAIPQQVVLVGTPRAERGDVSGTLTRGRAGRRRGRP